MQGKSSNLSQNEDGDIPSCYIVKGTFRYSVRIDPSEGKFSLMMGGARERCGKGPEKRAQCPLLRARAEDKREVFSSLLIFDVYY